MSNIGSFTTYRTQRLPQFEKHFRAVCNLQESEACNEAHRQLLSRLNVLLKRGGKRYRPLLFLLAYEGYGGKRAPVAYEIAAGLELLHAFFVIHDDIMDRDTERWGGTNITGMYFEDYSGTMPFADALRMAENHALLAGDSCLGFAYAKMPQDRLRQAMGRAVHTTIAGQLEDIAQIPQTQEEVVATYGYKTAAYSFGLPLQLAALITDHDDEVSLLAELATTAGIAYQLRDDLLNIHESTPAARRGSDLREGKQTVLWLAAMQRCTPDERSTLRACRGAEKIDHQKVVGIMEDCGAIAYVTDLQKTYMEKALSLIDNTQLTVRYQQLLADFLRNHALK